jgi:hypothetical protein
LLPSKESNAHPPLKTAKPLRAFDPPVFDFNPINLSS